MANGQVIRQDVGAVPRKVWNALKGVWEDERVQRALQVSGSSPHAGAVPLMPSREMTQSLAGSGRPSEKDVDAARARAKAAKESDEGRRSTDKSGQGTRQPVDEGSSDQPLPKAGSGPGAVMARTEGPRDAERASDGRPGGRPRAIKMPDGSMVMTNEPEPPPGPEAATTVPGRAFGEEGIPNRIPQEVPGADFVSGSEGTAFLGGEDDADFGGAGLSQDRSPGWAARAANNQLYRDGKLSMDPRDVVDRQKWEEHQTAKDYEKEVLEAQADQVIARAKIDPMEAARIEAEGRYGGEIIEQEALVARITAAVSAYKSITEEMNEINATMPDGPEKTQHLDRLEKQRREYANLVMGNELKDPKLDPMTAMMAMISGGPGAASKTEP